MREVRHRDVEDLEFVMYVYGFDDKEVRRAFIRKVFLIVAISLSITFGFCLIVHAIPELNLFVARKFWPLILACAVYFIVVMMVSCCPHLTKIFPLNIILFGLIVASLSYMAGAAAAYLETHAVLLAIAGTLGVVVIMVFVAVFIPIDLTAHIGWILILSLCSLLVGIVCMILYFVYQEPFINTIYCSIMIVVCCGFLWYVLQLIMGGKQMEFGPEDYIAASLMLYIYIVLIFIYILSIMRGTQ